MVDVVRDDKTQVVSVIIVHSFRYAGSFCEKHYRIGFQLIDVIRIWMYTVSFLPPFFATVEGLLKV